MIDEADRDGDGEINEAEFLRIMKKTSLYWSLFCASYFVKEISTPESTGCCLYQDLQLYQYYKQSRTRTQ